MGPVVAVPSTRRFRPCRPLDLALTLGPLRRGRFDPTMKIEGGAVWRATRTPDGAACLHLSAHSGEVRAEAWGPGAAWALEQAPVLTGSGDDDAGFAPPHPLLADLHRRMAGLRIPRTGAVLEALVPTILEQKVVGLEAKRSWRGLVLALGTPAPGPAGLLLPPLPMALAALPSWAFHRFGVERRRAETIRRAAGCARRLEETTSMDLAQGRRRLTVLPGIGPWSAAEVALVALGDADAVSVGDYHLPHQVSWALAGEARGDDARMLELLEPYRGHRGRVLRLLGAAGIWAPRFGPRMPLSRIQGT